MALAPGDHLAHYTILALIGKGGMGEVYRARDSRLNRDVAIKVSAQRFNERFEREAKVIASLNHPNICTLYDVGPNYLVMEYIEGDAPKGPLGLDAALAIARQMAAALEEAHSKGVTHRDLKPANIKVTPSGLVKVLDFGLAKVSYAPGELGEDSPTLTMGLSDAGMVLGTAGYMAPEQARGKVVDKRADIWAFGVVLHELFTGKRLFKGEDLTETLASVVKDAPPWEGIPTEARRLLESCLEKDPAKRLRDIGDAMRLLGGGGIDKQAEEPAPRAWIFATVGLGLVATGLSWVHFREVQEPKQVIRLQVDSEEGPPIASVSPDGRKIAYLGGSPPDVQVYLRYLDQAEGRAIAKAGSGNDLLAWSPDSKSLVYAVGAERRYKRIDIETNEVKTVATVPPGPLFGPTGGFWTGDQLFVSSTAGLSRVPAAGGNLTNVAPLSMGRPFLLPDGKFILYRGSAGILVRPLEDASSDPGTLLVPDGATPVWAAKPGGDGGYLVFLKGGALLAQPFDPQTRTLSGEAVALAEEASRVSVSPGTLVHNTAASNVPLSRLTWFDRQGNSLGTVGEAGLYGGFALSPNGTQAVVMKVDGGNSDLWLFDTKLTAGRGAPVRFTDHPGTETSPVWSRDGQWIAYVNTPVSTVKATLYRQRADLSTAPEKIVELPGSGLAANDWSPDGRFLLVMARLEGADNYDIWAVPMTGSDHKPIPVVRLEKRQSGAAFSPDGKMISYNSGNQRTEGVWVQPFDPDSPSKTANRRQIAAAESRWRPDWRELYYSTPEGWMSVPVKFSGSGIEKGTPTLLKVPPSARFDTIDGSRFLSAVANRDAGRQIPPYQVIVNWMELLKK